MSQNRVNASMPMGSSTIALGIGLLLAALWAYWTTLLGFADRWALPQYSHGYLVPAFAVGWLWFRRDRLQKISFQPSWWGLLLLAIGLAMRLWATHFYVTWFDGISLLPVLAGIVLLLGGWRCLLWAFPAIGFLFFMVPLPYRIEIGMGAPLQRFAAISSTFLLQTVGLPAIREGNVIVFDNVRLGVVEACSGLRMLFIFFAVSSAVALSVRRSLWQKVVILISTVPIALFVNVLRITVTGMLMHWFGSESKLADAVFHDLAGWLMMPAALLLLWLEMIYLSHLTVETRRAPVALKPTASMAALKQATVRQPARGRAK